MANKKVSKKQYFTVIETGLLMILVEIIQIRTKILANIDLKTRILEEKRKKIWINGIL
jgi:hypothetical protein